MKSLADIQKEYENCYDIKIMRRVPVVIRLNGRNFTKLTREVKHPFDDGFIEIMTHTLVQLCKQIDGSVFGYQFSDEITIVIKNDQAKDTDPWFGNRCQKIASGAAAIATYEFNKYFWNMSKPPPLTGAPLFDARVFGLPNIEVVTNNLIWRQQDCVEWSISTSAYCELKKKLSRKKAQAMMTGKDLYAREQLLWDVCNIEFEEEYSNLIKRGIGCYLVPDISSKKKWHVDLDLPIFSEDRDFIFNILSSGSDIFRPERS